MLPKFRVDFSFLIYPLSVSLYLHIKKRRKKFIHSSFQLINNHLRLMIIDYLLSKFCIKMEMIFCMLRTNDIITDNLINN